MPRRQSHRSTGVFPYIFRCNTRCPPCSSRIYRKSAEISASLADDRCFRLFDFQLRCFNNGIQRKFAEIPLAPILPKHSRKFCPVAHPCSRDPTPRLPGGHPPRISHREGVFSDFRFSNYVVLTTEFSANSPNSPSRRARQHRNLKFRCFNNVNNFANRKCTHISGSAASNRGTHPQACRITSDPALVSLSCLHANASTFFLAPSNRTPPNRIPLKPSAPPSRHKSHPTP